MLECGSKDADLNVANGTTRTFRDVRSMSVIEGISEVKYSLRVFRMRAIEKVGVLRAIYILVCAIISTIAVAFLKDYTGRDVSTEYDHAPVDTGPPMRAAAGAR